MKKRILAIILAMITALSFVACSDDDDSDRSTRRKKKDNTSSTDVSGIDFSDPSIKDNGMTFDPMNGEIPDISSIRGSESNISKDEAGTENKVSANIDLEIPDYTKVKIKSYSIVDGYYGEDKYITFTMDFTNLYDNADLNLYHFLSHCTLYQDNAQLSHIAYNTDKDTSTSIRKNGTVEVRCTFILRNTSSDIEFECEYDGEVCDTATLSIR